MIELPGFLVLRRPARIAAVWSIVLALAGCGAGVADSGASAGDGQPSEAVAVKAVGAASLQRDALVLLVPDGADEAGWAVKAWVDAAADEGLRVQIVNASTFLGLGTGAPSRIRALAVPDSVHQRMSDQLVAALGAYVNGGGRLMLTYDAGSLTASGFYSAGASRLSSLAGVPYVLYDTLWDQTVGIGPVVGTKTALTSFGLPPGKYVPFTGTLTAKALNGTPAATRYLPVSPADPGGQARALEFTRSRPGSVAKESRVRAFVSPSGPSGRLDQFPSAAPRLDNGARLGELEQDLSGSSGVPSTVPDHRLKAVTDPLQTVSGYGYDQLSYYSFVTRGTYNGTALLVSPMHGVVAGRRTQGSGTVLFVNLPLGYFKAIGTDSAPLHGALSYFAQSVCGLPRLSQQPKGIGGLVYNWHVDDGDDLTVDAKWLLNNTNVFNRGPFSLHFTAGPDTAAIGDRLGMNLPNDPAAQDLVRRLGNLGRYAGRLRVNHALGSHGGWIHDVYGLNVTETNAITYLPWLQLNADAVRAITGKVANEYSAPQGNNPLWALKWLQGQGVLGFYYAGDIGTSAVRPYRDGTMPNPGMWAFPVTPQGKWATFEEFDENGVNDATTLAWLSELQDFVVARRTNRLIYNHPPGARAHVNGVVEPMLRRAELKGAATFQWYTIGDLATFLNRRNAVSWTVTSNGAGRSTFTASHPSNLADVTLLVPRTRYGAPSVTSGSAAVTSDAGDWIVTVRSGVSVTFTASEL